MRVSLVSCAGFLAMIVWGVGAPAANIAWITFHEDADVASAAAMSATPPHTVAPDKAYTDLLIGAGHTVDRFLTTENFDVSQLNSYDLVIIGRSVNSGNYDSDAETAAWNGLSVPMIVTGGYVLRNSRLGFTTGTTIPDTAGPINLTVNQPSHPIFAGVALDGSNTMVNPFADVVTFSGALQRGISVNTNPVAGSGAVLATVGTSADPAFGGMIIGEWQAGDTLATTPADILGGHRLVFLTGAREASGSSSETAGLYDLSADGQQMFLNAVNYMAIPEPSSIVLLSLGALSCGLLRLRGRQAAR
jgi:hypothetical protein